MEVLAEDAILGVGELPAAERTAGLRRVPVLGGRIAPVRRYRADQHPVAGANDLHRAADLGDDTDSLVAEREVGPRADTTPDGV